jgi:hypothetical protein
MGGKGLIVEADNGPPSQENVFMKIASSVSQADVA